MTITRETIDEFFERYGWTSNSEDGEIWRTGFQGDVSSFNILIRLTEDWLFFLILPFVVAPTNMVCRWRLHHYLLRVNQLMSMAKFYVDSDGDVGLAVELPTENLDYSEFADALNALSYYADKYYLEALNIAQNTEALSPFETEQETQD
jgi:hypothetical protein